MRSGVVGDAEAHSGRGGGREEKKIIHSWFLLTLIIYFSS